MDGEIRMLLAEAKRVIDTVTGKIAVLARANLIVFPPFSQSTPAQSAADPGQVSVVLHETTGFAGPDSVFNARLVYPVHAVPRLVVFHLNSTLEPTTYVMIRVFPSHPSDGCQLVPVVASIVVSADVDELPTV